VRPASKAPAFAAGAGRVAQEALQGWSASPAAAAAALELLWSLAALRENKLVMFREGCLELAVSALRAFPASRAVQVSGLGALASIAWFAAVVQERARRLGALGLAAAARAAFQGREGAAVRERCLEIESLLGASAQAQAAWEDPAAFMPNM